VSTAILKSKPSRRHHHKEHQPGEHMENDGGSAFPTVESQREGSCGEYYTEIYSAGGMTLRDYFAAKELARMEHAMCMINDVQGAYDRVAAHCYRMADAMLKARQS